MFYPELLPPLPVTLEEAHREINDLRRRLHFANKNWGETAVSREKERRAAKGNIQSVKDLNRGFIEALKDIDKQLKKRQLSVGFPTVTDDPQDVVAAIKRLIKDLENENRNE